MTPTYIIGVTLGIVGGVLTQLGQLIEKLAVNKIRKNTMESSFMLKLLKNRIWISGVLVGVFGGTAAYMASQSLIGPALTPGLMASGLIVLAIGSVRLNNEILNASEITGIGLMIIGIIFLGLSELRISQSQVRITIADHDALVRITVFTFCLLVLSFISRASSNYVNGRKGMLIALSNGFLAALSDFWINPFLALFVIVLGGRGSFSQNIIFTVAALILIIAAITITWQSQLAFKVAQASNVVPVAQVPVQISPIVVYFFNFALIPRKEFSVVFIFSGTIITIISGFLLGRRKEEIDL